MYCYYLKKYGASIWLLIISLSLHAIEARWPTDNLAFFQNRPMEFYLQATASGTALSGSFGCVRNNGTRFHEGIDVKSIHRDRRNRTTDTIYAVLPGQVAYVNHKAGFSSYGCYIVIQHKMQNFCYYSMYAHLSQIHVHMGQMVKQGDKIGVMGNTACYNIPWARAHLHFEIGLSLGSKESFQTWYNAQGFKQANHHVAWNGFNLIGLNPLDFFHAQTNFLDFVQQQATAFTLRIYSNQVPPFIQQNKALLTTPLIPNKELKGWKIAFTWLGCPIRWTPLYEGQNHQICVCSYNKTELLKHGCRHTLEFNAQGQAVIGKLLQKILQLLFNNQLRL